MLNSFESDSSVCASLLQLNFEKELEGFEPIGTSNLVPIECWLNFHSCRKSLHEPSKIHSFVIAHFICLFNF